MFGRAEATEQEGKGIDVKGEGCSKLFSVRDPVGMGTHAGPLLKIPDEDG